MKIIVTGGAGFIASHVVDAYIAAGHRVAVIDNLSSGKRSNLNPRAKFYKADIRDLSALTRIFKRERPDAINHHAAFISVTNSVKRPAETFEINARGTLNVLLAATGAGAEAGAAGRAGARGHAATRTKTSVKKFIFSSTGGAIYGNPKKLPADETTTPNPLSPYAVTKLMDEEMIKYFCGTANGGRGIPYLILRYANAYGPRQRGQGGAGVFPIFTELMQQGKTPVIFGNGKKTRDYVYVGDIARANVLGLAKGVNETVNICGNREISDDAVFNALAKALDFKKIARHTPPRAGEVKRIRMSYTKAKRVLGWEPKVTFEEGVKKTVIGKRQTS